MPKQDLVASLGMVCERQVGMCVCDRQVCVRVGPTDHTHLLQVVPKEGDTADRSKYYQGIKFYDPEIIGGCAGA